MSIYRELYFYLFAALADAVDLLERGDTAGARQLLISAQQTAEERIVDAVPEHED